MRYPYLLFDLDGTLTDPGEGITNSVAYALAHFGIEVPDKKALYSFIGPPLKDSFSQVYHIEENRLSEAVETYRIYFRDKGIFENLVYDGISEMLDELRLRGHTLFVATSKPEPFAVQILDHFGLNGYFSDICGSTMAETRTSKSEVLAYALEKNHISAENALMIGDRRHDIEGARACGMSGMGVLWGYGSRRELTDAGAAFLASDRQDLLRQLTD